MNLPRLLQPGSCGIRRGKEAATGNFYEPWHFRYVGPEFAKALVESGLTLDEASEHLTSS